MGESRLSVELTPEVTFRARAGEVARAWRAGGLAPAIVGLEGELGAGKTTWVRGMLEGLGHQGPVPSPTFTLVEPYELGGLVLVHLDLYRLAGAEDLEGLGIRDWLARTDVWLLVEWPERAANFEERCDVLIHFELVDETTRAVALQARSPRGRRMLSALDDIETNSSNKG